MDGSRRGKKAKNFFFYNFCLRLTSTRTLSLQKISLQDITARYHCKIISLQDITARYHCKIISLQEIDVLPNKILDHDKRILATTVSQHTLPIILPRSSQVLSFFLVELFLVNDLAHSLAPQVGIVSSAVCDQVAELAGVPEGAIDVRNVVHSVRVRKCPGGVHLISPLTEYHLVEARVHHLRHHVQPLEHVFLFPHTINTLSADASTALIHSPVLAEIPVLAEVLQKMRGHFHKVGWSPSS